MRILSTIVIGFLFVLGSFSQSHPDIEIWNDGIGYLKEGDYIRSVEKMNEIIQRYPNNHGALYNRAIAKVSLGDIKGACTDFNQSILYGNKKKKVFNYLCDENRVLRFLQKHFYPETELLKENGYRPSYSRKDTLRGKLRPERTCFDVIFYDLTIRFGIPSKSISGKNEIWFKQVENSGKIQLDLFSNLKVDSIIWKNRTLNFVREHDAVWVTFPEELKTGTLHQIEFYYHGKPKKAPNPPWDGGFVWSRDKKFNHMVGVACEQLGASVWWPNKDHLSDKPDSMAINIEVPDRFDVVSNGTLRGIEQLQKGYKRHKWFVSYPINNYNATFYVGKYTSFSEFIVNGKDSLKCDYYVMPYHLDMARDYFKQADEVIGYYNKSFGYYPFPRDGFKLVESSYSGMEHQSAIAFGNEYKGDDRSITYNDYTYDYLIVHETAHEWWGNVVTAGDMADAWIHEGFATYAELIFTEDRFGHSEYLNELQNRMFEIHNFWPMVDNRDVNEDSFASNDIYTKGATMIHCFRSTLNNDSVFFNLIRDLNLKFRFQTMDSYDFIEFVNDYTGQDYTAFFNKYLFDTDLPVLEYDYKRQNGNIHFSYKWTGVEEPFNMPFAIEFGDNQTLRLAATTTQQEVVLADTETFSFFNMFSDPRNAPRNGYTYYWTEKSEF